MESLAADSEIEASLAAAALTDAPSAPVVGPSALPSQSLQPRLPHRTDSELAWHLQQEELGLGLDQARPGRI